MRKRLTVALMTVCAVGLLLAKNELDDCPYCGLGEPIPSLPTPTPSTPSVDDCDYCDITSGGTSSGGGWTTGSGTAWSKSATKDVYVVDIEGKYAGTATISTAKRSKNGTVKVKVTLKMAAGKTYTAKATSFTPDDDDTIDAAWEDIKGLGDVELTITPDGEVSGMAGDYEFSDSYETDEDGERFTHGGHTFSVEEGDFELDEKYELISETIPNSYEIVTTSKKWNCGKAPSIKYKKYKEDGMKWYELVGFDDESKPNLSSLKITFNAKKNTFKGSFKVYATNEFSIDDGKKPKLKKFSFTVSGYVNGGVCSGTATCKKLKAVWPITVE